MVGREAQGQAKIFTKMPRPSLLSDLSSSLRLDLYQLHHLSSLHLRRAPDLQTSIPPRLHACNTLPDLRTHVCTSAARLQSSIFCTLTAGLQISRTPYLDVATELHTSTSLHLQRASRALYLHVCTLTAGLQISIPPRLHAYSAPTDLHTSMPRRRYTCSALPVLHTSTSACLQRASRALYSARLQRTSRSPDLHTSMSLHL